ncbi:MAG: SBBP repeat-containing protein [Candidatus Hydrothermia bacterium]|jgi:hypothetical protein
MKMLFKYLVYVVSFAIFGKLYAHESFSFSNVKNLFIENVGQYPSEILYSSFPTKAFALKDRIIINDIEIVFKNINENVKVKGRDMEIATFNYFKGNNPDNWKTNVVSYSKVIYENLYKNIDLIFTGLKGNKIEFQFIVKPKANVSDIAYEINCKECEIINKGKEILIKKEGREILSIENLKAYQGADEIEISFKNKGNIITYEVGKYNKNEILIIDPDLSSLLASTYLGGNYVDYGLSIYVDNSGYVYVAGGTGSSDFPTNGYDNSFNGGFRDVFISKFDNSLSTLLASTFLGGSDDESASSIYVVGIYVYVTGFTRSSDFPISPTAYDNTLDAGDVFVSKLNNQLSALIASTFLGGSSDEEACCISVDASGNVYVAGRTVSTDFPTTPSAYDNSHNGIWDAFVSKLDNNLTSLLASTYLGGSIFEAVYSLYVDGSGNVYVVGETSSSDFPTTPSAYDNTYNGPGDAFISKFNSSLSTLAASTFLGGSGSEIAFSVFVDQSGNVYVAGMTTSSDFPTTLSAYDNSFNGAADAFISKFDNSLSTLIASTFLGGSGFDRAISIFLDSNKNVYVSGITFSSDFPTTPSAYDNSINGGVDVFVSKLDSSLSSLIASTYLGGTDDDFVQSLFVEQDDEVFVCGYTRSTDFPTTTPAYDPNFNGGFWDVFVSKFNNSSISTFENNLTNTFKIFKNSIIFNIKTPSYIGINIYNPSGMLIKRISYGFVGIGNYEIKLNDLKKGTYILKVRIGEEVKEVKFIKQ